LSHIYVSPSTPLPHLSLHLSISSLLPPTPPQFRELREVSSRYQTLLSTRDALLRLVQERQEEVKSQRGQLARFMEVKNDELLSFNNQLAILQGRLEAAQARALYWDTTWTHIQNTAAKRTLVLGTVKMAALNLYHMVVAYLGEEPSIPAEHTLQQFRKIAEFLHYMQSVYDDLSGAPRPAK
ncbi:LOW QUALITY PROTEIN: coiled-coil domain-containing protein 42-like, partial [Narcine bancroftii]|uniref:LOW QUALITY PROTEIN: coiled-coil domain-containing protein 42-like n=1 Tax=Narcine bancroftii TaxID=1343680 RepID=UPI0038314D87